MIIISIIILYFIQIRHTDDFPSMGIPASIYNQQCEKNEVRLLGRAHQPPKRRPMDLAYHHLETIMTRKYEKRDQPCGGETTWTNTGATRSGRVLRSIG